MLALIAATMILVLLYTQPRVLGAAGSHWLGRLLLVALVALCAFVHPAVGVLAVVVYIASMDQREGMTVAGFRHNNCRRDPDGERRLVDAADQTVPMANVKDTYPEVSFTGSQCNPCDSDCKFDLLETETLVQGRTIASDKPAATTSTQLLEKDLSAASVHDKLRTPSPLPKIPGQSAA